MQQQQQHWLVVFSHPSEKYAQVKLDHESPGIRGENKKYLKPPPRTTTNQSTNQPINQSTNEPTINEPRRTTNQAPPVPASKGLSASSSTVNNVGRAFGPVTCRSGGCDDGNRGQWNVKVYGANVFSSTRFYTSTLDL